MSDTAESDDLDLLGRIYRRYWHVVRNWFFVVLWLLLFAVVFGVPHVQTTYHYTGFKPPGKSPTAAQKTDAWYISVTGWKHIEADQYGYPGCPVFLFVPLSDCVRTDSVSP